MLKKAMIYLGLGPDEHYDEAPRTQNGPPPAGRYPSGHGHPPSVSSITDPGTDVSLGRTVRPIPIGGDQSSSLAHDDLHTRPRLVTSSRSSVEGRGSSAGKPYAVSPEEFNDAKEIGDRFKSGQAVIVNLQTVSRDLRRRLVDFSSGLCYARDGKMDRVADHVFLLTPMEPETSRSRIH